MTTNATGTLNTTRTAAVRDLSEEALAARIEAYLPVHRQFSEPDLGSIDTCLAIVGRFEPGDTGYDRELVQAAGESIADFMSDFGVSLLACAVRTGEARIIS